MTLRARGLFAAAVVLVLLAAVRCRTTSQGLWLPSLSLFRQERPYSCGAAAFRMVLARYGVFETEADLREELGSAETHGTSHHRLIEAARARGLDAHAAEDSSLAELRRAVRHGEPTIIALQAWGDADAYDAAESGHYVVVAGYRDQRFYFADPWDGALHELDETVLLERWHDVDAEGTPVRRLALFFRGKPSVRRRSER